MKQRQDKQGAETAPPGVPGLAFGQTRGRVWAWLLLGWLVLGVFSSAGPFIQLPRTRSAMPPIPLSNLPARMFVAQWSVWVLWVTLAPVALWLRRRFPFERTGLQRTLPAHILAIVVFGLAHALLGIVLGLGGAYALTRWLESLLFGVRATDDVTFAGVPSVLLLITLLSCLLPARRATKVDPLVALRHE